MLAPANMSRYKKIETDPMDDEFLDYLTDKIADFNVFNRPVEELFEILNQHWWPQGSNEWTPDKNGVIRVATGGWSENQAMIGALRRNLAFWSLYWEASCRGGEHVFVVKRERDDPL